jgi:hypothetical protein
VDVIQEEGETIFVPSGWYHQVHNLCDTISINHNWCNTYNILGMWQHIQDQRRDVIKALNGYNFDAIPPVVNQLTPRVDIKLPSPPSITDDEIETVLRAEAGIDLKAFWRFLIWNGYRLCCLLLLTNTSTSSPVPSSSSSSAPLLLAMPLTVVETSQKGVTHISTILHQLVVHPVIINAMSNSAASSISEASSSSPPTAAATGATTTQTCPLTQLVTDESTSSSAAGVRHTIQQLRPSEWPVIAQSLKSLDQLRAIIDRIR